MKSSDQIAAEVAARYPARDFDLHRAAQEEALRSEAASEAPQKSAQESQPQSQRRRIRSLEREIVALRAEIVAARAETSTAQDVLIEATGQCVQQMIDKVYAKVEASILHSSTDMHSFIAKEIGQMRAAVDEAIAGKRGKSTFRFAGEKSQDEPAALDGEIIPPGSLATH